MIVCRLNLTFICFRVAASRHRDDILEKCLKTDICAIHVNCDMLPSSSSNHKFSLTPTSQSAAPHVYYPNLRKLGHLSRFSNMTYGEVLSTYQTPSTTRKCSVALSEQPKPASHHYKQVNEAIGEPTSGRLPLAITEDVHESKTKGIYVNIAFLFIWVVSF